MFFCLFVTLQGYNDHPSLNSEKDSKKLEQFLQGPDKASASTGLDQASRDEAACPSSVAAWLSSPPSSGIVIQEAPPRPTHDKEEIEKQVKDIMTYPERKRMRLTANRNELILGAPKETAKQNKDEEMWQAAGQPTPQTAEECTKVKHQAHDDAAEDDEKEAFSTGSSSTCLKDVIQET